MLSDFISALNVLDVVDVAYICGVFIRRHAESFSELISSRELVVRTAVAGLSVRIVISVYKADV